MSICSAAPTTPTVQRKPLKPRKCKAPGCGAEYIPRNSLVKVCSPRCSLVFVREKQARGYTKAKEKYERGVKARHKARREAIRTKGEWLRLVQVEFNAYIRARDYADPCISCQRHHTGQYHAGHYRPVGMGGGSPLRFSEINCHKQCSACNNHRGGAAIDYRINLVKKIGPKLVEWLELDHKPPLYTVDELKWLRKYYKQRTKEAKLHV